MPFTPEISLPTLQYLYDTYWAQIWTPYGFSDAFNLTANWWDTDVLGIDQGALLLMIENYRTGSVWQTFMKSSIIQQGLASAGFVPVTGVDDPGANLPRVPFLSQNFPNPFNPATVVEFSIPSRAQVRITIFDALGREINTLVDAAFEPGEHRVRWNASGRTSGVYFCRMTVDGTSYTRKLILIR